MARLKKIWKKMRTYDVKKEEALSENFYRYLFELDSM